MGLFTKKVRCEICSSKVPKKEALVGAKDGLCCSQQCLEIWNAVAGWRAPTTILDAEAARDNARLLLQAALQEIDPLHLMASRNISAKGEDVDHHITEYQRNVGEAGPFLSELGLGDTASLLAGTNLLDLLGSSLERKLQVSLSGGFFGQIKHILRETIILLGGEPVVD